MCSNPVTLRDEQVDIFEISGNFLETFKEVSA